MHLLRIIFIVTSLIFCSPVFSFPHGTQKVSIIEAVGIRHELLKNIAPIIEKSIQKNNYPGMVILVSHRGQLIYKGIFGNKKIKPSTAPMELNTIFDIASLTKVIATTPAIMQLIEQGKLDLDAPAYKYWPDFATHGKNRITIRELLTHTSGLPAETSAKNKKQLLTKIAKMKLQHPPGKKFLYSDVNFIVLAHLVERISHQSFDTYASKHIFKPLGMAHTHFNPDKKLKAEIAPTELEKNKLRWGIVQDPIARMMGGVSGHAGLFSTAEDLNRFAQSILNGGKAEKNYFLGPLAISKMTTQQTPSEISETRGLGWDIDSRYSNRGVLFPINSFGHTGWTGSSIWIDPQTQTSIIILTSRLHPKAQAKNELVEDRRKIANIVSGSITSIEAQAFKNTGKGEIKRAFKS